MIARVFGTKEAKEFRIEYQEWDAKLIWNVFVRKLAKAIYNTDIMDSIQNSDLKQVLEIIKKLREEHNFTLDMHAGNVMLRNTHLGLIPVITDPLSDDGRSIIGNKY